MQFTVVK